MIENSAAKALTDEQIVERVRAGELILFELLMRRNNTRVYRAVRALLQDEEEAEDAIQATYLQAYAHLGTFRSDARFNTWLTRIALNEALGRLRQRRRHPSISSDAVEESSMAVPTSESPPTPERMLQRRELASLLEKSVDGLPDLYRVVYMLRDVEGMDTAETADALEVSEDVVKTRLSRARALLRDHLKDAATEAFAFHAPRCDRVVNAVMSQLIR